MTGQQLAQRRELPPSHPSRTGSLPRLPHSPAEVQFPLQAKSHFSPSKPGHVDQYQKFAACLQELQDLTNIVLHAYSLSNIKSLIAMHPASMK